MTFTAISLVKYFNGLLFQPHFIWSVSKYGKHSRCDYKKRKKYRLRLINPLHSICKLFLIDYILIIQFFHHSTQLIYVYFTYSWCSSLSILLNNTLYVVNKLRKMSKLKMDKFISDIYIYIIFIIYKLCHYTKNKKG